MVSLEVVNHRRIQLGENVTMLDLSKAYLQVHVNRELWRYQKERCTV